MPVGAAIGIAGVAGAGAQIYGANQAANVQTQAAQNATQAQQGYFQQAKKGLNPYINMGKSSGRELQAQLPELTSAFNPTMKQLQTTPGYQFTLGQGEKAVQNSYAAKGLGSSGAALKGGADYAAGLASQTYQQQLNNYYAQHQLAYNMLLGPTQLGEQAAQGLAGPAIQTGSSVGSNIIGAGNAQAGAYTATGNAIASGLGSAAGGYAYGNYLSGSQNPLYNSAPMTGWESWTEQ